MASTFTASLAAFRDKTKAQMQAVLSASVQDVMEMAQEPQPSVTETGGSFVEGKIPVDTGHLRNSLVSELNGSPGPEGSESYVLVAAEMQPGDVARFGWTAEYALRLHSGFVGTDSLGRTYNVSGRFWLDRTVVQWPQIVERNAARLK
ncbi:hypothetical protein [Paracoccus benzoatiresistens]|uniref:HK97 gp10 family phage protein n=1 Tax=Paracoccus benzoatiresistens TaxID=2997341 RepID=A0ABT4J9S7_9RHOB|nr:hypothetical protein [Paracoccus sp. EF6]MCZ0963885.1 hypothetical protein [Paracoccus sp. EF6]